MCVQNREMVETCLQHFWSKPRLDSSGCWEGPLPCCTRRRIDVNQLANNNDVVDQLSGAGLAADLGPPSKCPERSVRGLAAWALKSYLNLFVLMFCSFCFVFTSVSFLFFMFYGFLKEFMACVKGVFWTWDWLAISLARRPTTKWIFSPKVNLEVFLCLNV